MNRTTSENAENPPEDHTTRKMATTNTASLIILCQIADRQNGSLCVGSETSNCEIVESDKEGIYWIWWGLRGRKLKIWRNHWITKQALTCKLLRLLPDRHMVRMIMEMVGNRSFTLTTGNDKRSRLRRLKNGVPQGSVLAPLHFNIYISDLPNIVSRKYAYADDLAIMHADGTDRQWRGAEQGHGNRRWIPPDLET